MKKVMLTLSATVAAAFFSGCICTETTTVPEVKIAGEKEAAPGTKNVEKKPAEPKPAEKKPAAEARPAEVKPAEKETAEKKPAAPAETPLILTDTVWTPVSLYNQGDVKLTKGTTVWFRIHPGKDIVGMSGVNRFSAPAEIPAPGKLKFGLMISTLMAGPEANMKYESQFLNALNRTKSYEITGRELKLFGADGKVLMNCVQAGPGVGEDASSK